MSEGSYIQLGDPYFEGSEETFGGEEPKPGDRGTCAYCGSEITLVAWRDTGEHGESGQGELRLDWTHSLVLSRIMKGQLVDRRHVAALGGPA